MTCRYRNIFWHFCGPAGQNVRKSFKICALCSSLNGSDREKIIYIKYGLKCPENTDADPFGRIPEDEVCLNNNNNNFFLKL